MQGVFPIGARFFYALRKKEIGYETKNLDSIPDSALGAMYRFGLAACGSFGGDPDESGDNGDDTTIVTPGDPDDNPVPPPEEDDPVAPPEEDDPVTPHEHTYTSEVTRELSCDQEGERIYTCTCGDSYTEPIAMIPHTEVIDAAVAPSCTATGLTEGKHCSVCGTVLIKQEVVPTIVHNYVDGVCTMCGAPEPQATEGIVFSLSTDGTQYSVTSYTGTAMEVYIPATYKGLPVTSIGERVFWGCSSLISITLSGNSKLASIGSRAFDGCSGLTSIAIPDSVTSIGDSAFA